MLRAPGQTSWSEAVVVLGGLLVVGFLVSWLVTDVLRWPRRLYISLLALVTVVGWALVDAVTGASLTDVLGHHWGAGLVAASVVGVLTGIGMRRKEPATQHLSRPELEVAAVWEGLVYGVAEGVLLSVLPTFVVWQAAEGAGWSGAGAGVVAVAASVAMIVVHHLGYWDFRGPQVGLAVVGCGVLTLAYVATGSVLAAALGHVLLHVVGVIGGIQLPPHARPGVRRVSAATA